MAQQEQGDFSNPAAPQKIPGLPENLTILEFDGFEGLNTKATRPAIEDQQCAWLDNWMPLGKSNLRTLYDIGSALFTAASGNSVQSFYFGNISSTPICIVFQGDGSIEQVNTVTKSSSVIAAAGTITTPANQKGVAQWGSQYILMVAPQTNGFFVWDGTSFYQAGTVGPSVTLSNSGLDYTSQPSIQAVGGFGSGASFSATLSSSGTISQITVSNPGTGYKASDFVTLAFNAGGSNATAIAKASITSAGVVQSIVMLVSGSGYNSATATASLKGGGGIGATVAVQSSGIGAGGSITALAITNSGGGYTSDPTVVFSDPNNPVAQATVAIMPFGVQGTTIETFQGRAWIGNGAAPSTPPAKSLVTFTAPQNPVDVNVNDGAGAFQSNDSFLRVGYHALRQTNGFLYLIGDSSVNYISGVQTSGNPPITTFNNQNVDPQVGTPWPDTVQVYSRAIVMANTFGIHALYGGSVQKVSTPVDGIFTSVAATNADPPTVGGIVPSSAVAIIFGIHVYMLLLPIIDQISKTQRNALIMWDGQKWWTAGQSVTLKFINSQEVDSVITAYGTDGISIYPLFATPSPNITKTARSKLWQRPTFLLTKQSQSVSTIFIANDNNPVQVNITVDTELGSSAAVVIANVFFYTWTNNNQSSFRWTNNSGGTFTWTASGLAVNGPQPANQSGRLMGMTITTTATDTSLVSTAIVAQQYETNL